MSSIVSVASGVATGLCCPVTSEKYASEFMLTPISIFVEVVSGVATDICCSVASGVATARKILWNPYQPEFN
jgi:hypothetical protein